VICRAFIRKYFDTIEAIEDSELLLLLTYAAREDMNQLPILSVTKNCCKTLLLLYRLELMGH
jgi:hypothetical protein